MEELQKYLSILKISIKMPLFVAILLLALIIGVFIFLLLRSSPVEVPVLSEEAEQILIADDINKIIIDVAGSVANPGLYTVAKGARVGDVLELSGGLVPNAAYSWISQKINLADILEDSQKVYFPYAWEAYESTQSIPTADDICRDELFEDVLPMITPLPSVSDATGKINVNSATQDDLDTLPGIGPTYAAKMLLSKPYKDFQDLIDRSGVPETTLNKIKDEIIFTK